MGRVKLCTAGLFPAAWRVVASRFTETDNEAAGASTAMRRRTVSTWVDEEPACFSEVPCHKLPSVSISGTLPIRTSNTFKNEYRLCKTMGKVGIDSYSYSAVGGLID